MKKSKMSDRWFFSALWAFIASLGLNIDLSLVISLDNFRIEGYPIARYQEVSGNLSDSMNTIAAFFAGFSGNSVLWLCIFFALFFLFRRAAVIKDKHIIKYSSATAVVFSLLYVFGFSINKYNSLIAITDSTVTFLKSLIAFIGIAFVFYGLLTILFDKIKNYEFDDAKIKKAWIFDANRKAFFIRCAIIFICWLPYLIVYLPGFLSRDTVGQLSQALGDSPLSDHHPIFMTGLFGTFIRIGIFFGDTNIGLLLYSLFQMLIMAMAFSYVLKYMAEKNAHIYLRISTFIFFAFYPVNPFYSIMMWKDTLFSIVFMMLTLKTIQMVSNPDYFFNQRRNVLAFGLLCAALFLTRNNGVYILFILLPVLLIFLRKHWKSMLSIMGIFLICFASIQIINTALNVQKGSIGEALSIPLQQIARTVTIHGDEISDNDKFLINSILPYEQISELYEPTISDPIKAVDVFNEKVFKADTGLYMSLWTRFLFMYPVTYIEAFLCQTHGYWYPDVDYWIVARELYENDYGIHHWRIVPSFVDNVFSGVFVFRVLPSISMLVSIGFAVWVTIIMALTLMLKKNYNMLLVFLPVFLLWLTCMASPVSGMFRYIYGLFLVLPLLIFIALQSDKCCNE